LPKIERIRSLKPHFPIRLKRCGRIYLLKNA
jgi:hypothetical protein